MVWFDLLELDTDGRYLLLSVVFVLLIRTLSCFCYARKLERLRFILCRDVNRLEDVMSAVKRLRQSIVSSSTHDGWV
jgi:hypothetical protein